VEKKNIYQRPYLTSGILTQLKYLKILIATLLVKLKGQLAVTCSISNLPFVVLNRTCPPKSFHLHSCYEDLGFIWPDTLLSKGANTFRYLKMNCNFHAFESQLTQATGLSWQHLYNPYIINDNYVPNDSKFDKLCRFQNLPHWADFQVTGSFKRHARRHPVHHHAARVNSDFSVWDFHRKIHTNGFT